MLKTYHSYNKSRHVYSTTQPGYVTLRDLVTEHKSGNSIEIICRGKDVTNSLLKKQLISKLNQNNYTNAELLTLIERAIKYGSK